VAGAAAADRALVADQLAATVGEDGWSFGQARAVSVAAAGGELSDTAVVRKHGTANEAFCWRQPDGDHAEESKPLAAGRAQGGV
jgi:hypothetical protein